MRLTNVNSSVTNIVNTLRVKRISDITSTATKCGLAAFSVATSIPLITKEIQKSPAEHTATSIGSDLMVMI